MVKFSGTLQTRTQDSAGGGERGEGDAPWVRGWVLPGPVACQGEQTPTPSSCARNRSIVATPALPRPLPASLSGAWPGQSLAPHCPGLSSKAEVLRVGLERLTLTRPLWPRCELQPRAEDAGIPSEAHQSQSGWSESAESGLKFRVRTSSLICPRLLGRLSGCRNRFPMAKVIVFSSSPPRFVIFFPPPSSLRLNQAVTSERRVEVICWRGGSGSQHPPDRRGSGGGEHGAKVMGSGAQAPGGRPSSAARAA